MWLKLETTDSMWSPPSLLCVKYTYCYTTCSFWRCSFSELDTCWWFECFFSHLGERNLHSACVTYCLGVHLWKMRYICLWQVGQMSVLRCACDLLFCCFFLLLICLGFLWLETVFISNSWTQVMSFFLNLCQSFLDTVRKNVQVHETWKINLFVCWYCFVCVRVWGWVGWGWGVCVCACMRVCVCMHACLLMCVLAQVCVFTDVSLIQSLPQLCLCVCLHASVCVCTHTWLCVQAHSVCVCVCVCLHSYVWVFRHSSSSFHRQCVIIIIIIIIVNT